MRSLSVFIALIVTIAVISAEFIAPTIWPQPKSFKYGDKTATVSKFTFATVGEPVKTLSLAYDRYNSLIFRHAQSEDSANGVSRVEVSVENSSEDYPQMSTDESYTLSIPATGSSSAEIAPVIKITAVTVYGALRALESLSQLVVYDFDSQSYLVTAAPVMISDEPRYPHRGMLLDTSRHFQPISFLQQTIDALSYAKYNVLHWHVVDTQSFPFESKAYPRLWDGAYTKQEKYSHSDIVELVEYGRQRGVKIMIEFDMPGHAASWCTGYPEICPSMSCKQPLDPSSEMTFPLITGLLAECTGASGDKPIFPYELLHLGGDEVSYTCWEASSDIQAWEKAQGIDGSEGTYEYFVDKVATIARDQDRLPVQWVEVFEHFGSSLSNDTVVHVWKEKTTMDGVLTAGYRALLSNQDSWYLDHLDTTWQTMYLNEPTEGLSPTSDPSLILGGESCMWGETVDPSDLQNTVWPRAAAVAEVLWSPYDAEATKRRKETGDMDEVEDRLETFRCLLNERGISAAPVTNIKARYQPPQPGSCYVQRRKL